MVASLIGDVKVFDLVSFILPDQLGGGGGGGVGDVKEPTLLYKKSRRRTPRWWGLPTYLRQGSVTGPQ